MLKCDIGQNCSKISRKYHCNAAGSFCNKHYLQMRRHGKVLHTTQIDARPAIIEGDVAKIPLGVDAINGYTIVDKKYAYLAKDNWNISHYGYARSAKEKKLLHRLILDAASGTVVDHVNGDRLDNRLANIRLCTQSENARNQTIRKNNKSGHKGVTAQSGSYRARIKVDYQTIELGIYKTAVEAARAYNEAAQKYFAEFARLNNV